MVENILTLMIDVEFRTVQLVVPKKEVPTRADTK